VYHDIEDIRLRLKSGERNSDGSLRTFIIQKYIENPMLYNGRKFDIRHFLLISCVNGSYKAYWFEEGYARTSSSLFTLKRGSTNFVHLTNDAIQKYSKDYGKF
jgi:tubulin---tyrosine ligase